MLTIHEIGTYTVNSNRVLDIYMVEHQGGLKDGSGDYSPPEISYCLDVNGRSKLVYWTDWPSFAQQVNKVAMQKILDPMGIEPAVEVGLAVVQDFACPNCGCRIMDALNWIDDEVQCNPCGTTYEPADW